MWTLVAHHLENARTLATLDKGRPREASLRRAVSTAYYSLFQALCEMCAARLVTWNRPWEAFSPIFRALDHRRTVQVLTQSDMTNTPELRRLGYVFKELQAVREWADYNPEPRPKLDPMKNNTRFKRSEALAFIDLAEEAIRIIDRLGDGERLKLAVRLVALPRR